MNLMDLKKIKIKIKCNVPAGIRLLLLRTCLVWVELVLS